MTSTSPRTAPDTEGTVIARKYRLESLIGEGGMGFVWRALNLQLELPVAIKLLRPGFNTREFAERLRVEARAVARLVHPSIVRVFDTGESESGEPFIVMELLNGESLGTLLDRGPLPQTMALQLLLPIANALTLAHGRGIVHRDLKPDNIFISAEGPGLQPKLLDFGVATVMSALVPGAPSATQGGVLVGSPDYMSPEQVRGCSDIDQRADVWGFCVVLYEALSGQAPFEGDSAEAILRSVLLHEPRPLNQVAPVDAVLARLVHSGLAKQRDDRPTSIFELGQQLAAWLFAQGVRDDVTGTSLELKWLGRQTAAPFSEPPAAPSPPLRRRPALSALVASGALVACITGLSAYKFQPSSGIVNGATGTTTPAMARGLSASRSEAASPTPVSPEAIPGEAEPNAQPPRSLGLRFAQSRVASAQPPATTATRGPRTELMNPY